MLIATSSDVRLEIKWHAGSESMAGVSVSQESEKKTSTSLQNPRLPHCFCRDGYKKKECSCGSENKFHNLTSMPKSSEMEGACVLDSFNSDLNLLIDPDGCGATVLLQAPGFLYCWAGARATYGVNRGKVYFEIKIVEYLRANYPKKHSEQHPHLVRVGWSSDLSSFQLGEDIVSYGYDGTAHFSSDGMFWDYGERFGAEDVIGCCLDLDSTPATIAFTKNGVWQGTAVQLPSYQTGLHASTLFPHIMAKNCRFKVNFGQDRAYCYLPPEGYQFIGLCPKEHRVCGTKSPEKTEDCEVIMLIGLPGAGKTTWGREMQKSYPEKRYNILGVDTILDKMTVMGQPRKQHCGEHFAELLIRAEVCLRRLVNLAIVKKRNYILDGTHEYAPDRRRKISRFQGFKKLAVVVQPSEEEMTLRFKQKISEDCAEINEMAILERKANFTLPTETEGIFHSISFFGLPRANAEQLVAKFALEGQLNRTRKKKKPLRHYPLQQKRQSHCQQDTSGPTSLHNQLFQLQNQISLLQNQMSSIQRQNQGKARSSATIGQVQGPGAVKSDSESQNALPATATVSHSQTALPAPVCHFQSAHHDGTPICDSQSEGHADIPLSERGDHGGRIPTVDSQSTVHGHISNFHPQTTGIGGQNPSLNDQIPGLEGKHSTCDDQIKVPADTDPGPGCEVFSLVGKYSGHHDKIPGLEVQIPGLDDQSSSHILGRDALASFEKPKGKGFVRYRFPESSSNLSNNGVQRQDDERLPQEDCYEQLPAQPWPNQEAMSGDEQGTWRCSSHASVGENRCQQNQTKGHEVHRIWNQEGQFSGHDAVSHLYSLDEAGSSEASGRNQTTDDFDDWNLSLHENKFDTPDLDVWNTTDVDDTSNTFQETAKDYHLNLKRKSQSLTERTDDWHRSSLKQRKIYLSEMEDSFDGHNLSQVHEETRSNNLWFQEIRPEEQDELRDTASEGVRVLGSSLQYGWQREDMGDRNRTQPSLVERVETNLDEESNNTASDSEEQTLEIETKKAAEHQELFNLNSRQSGWLNWGWKTFEPSLNDKTVHSVCDPEEQTLGIETMNAGETELVLERENMNSRQPETPSNDKETVSSCEEKQINLPVKGLDSFSSSNNLDDSVQEKIKLALQNWEKKKSKECRKRRESLTNDYESEENTNEDHPGHGHKESDMSMQSQRNRNRENDWAEQGHRERSRDYDRAGQGHREWNRDNDRAGQGHRESRDYDQAGQSHREWSRHNDRAGQGHRERSRDHDRAEQGHRERSRDHDRAEQGYRERSRDHDRAEQGHRERSRDHDRAGQGHREWSRDNDRAGQGHREWSRDNDRAGQGHRERSRDHDRAGQGHRERSRDNDHAEQYLREWSRDNDRAGQGHREGLRNDRTVHDLREWLRERKRQVQGHIDYNRESQRSWQGHRDCGGDSGRSGQGNSEWNRDSGRSGQGNSEWNRDSGRSGQAYSEWNRDSGRSGQGYSEWNTENERFEKSYREWNRETDRSEKGYRAWNSRNDRPVQAWNTETDRWGQGHRELRREGELEGPRPQRLH